MTGGGARVLYVDDDAGVRRLAARALERRGYRVTPAAGGAEGLGLATDTVFDLIAVDHYMPGMDGLEMLARLRAAGIRTCVVYVTGSDEGRIAVAALKAGAADYVVKTVGEDFFDLLAASFEQVLARAALERDKTVAETDLRAVNARLEALLREVNHRVANSLQLVSAMVGMQARQVTEPAAVAALEDTQRRIAAIAQVHRRLYTSDEVESVDMADYLAALVAELEGTWCAGTPTRRLTLRSDPVRLHTDKAVSVGVIVNELVSNAFKYAYSDTKGGEVRLILTQEGDARFRLVVEDDGPGFSGTGVVRGTGVGTRIIAAMAESMGTRIEYDARHLGVRAVLSAAA